MPETCEIESTTRFDKIRYAQCWEDADVLLEVLEVRPDDAVLSIASAGDNCIALVGAGAKRVIAVDVSPAQIACLELRVAAYRCLNHEEFLQLLGQNECSDRLALYQLCRGAISCDARAFWDQRAKLLVQGIAACGKFERYLSIFRRFVLPLVQRSQTIRALFEVDSQAERRELYDKAWNNWRWRFLCRIFFASAFLGPFGRDPNFTRYADEPIWASLRRRLPNALVTQRPAENPFLQQIIFGRCRMSLPYAWRQENFDRIRENLDALEWHCAPIERVIGTLPERSVQGFNLSDIFEYMSQPACDRLLGEMVRVGDNRARLVYWNVVANRSRPLSMAERLRELSLIANRFHERDTGFFYRRLVVEEVIR